MDKTLLISTNRSIFNFFKTDYLPINDVLKLLEVSIIPTELPIKNNHIFIRDLSKFVINQNKTLDFDRLM